MAGYSPPIRKRADWQASLRAAGSSRPEEAFLQQQNPVRVRVQRGVIRVLARTSQSTLSATAGSMAVARWIGPKVATSEVARIIMGTSAKVPGSRG
jgi:hypothetical protein